MARQRPQTRPQTHRTTPRRPRPPRHALVESGRARTVLQPDRGCSSLFQLLRYLSDGPLRGRVTAATNKVEAFNGCSDWVRFGQRGTVAHNDPVEQEKDVKSTSLLANLLIFHNTLDIADVVRQLQAEGWEIDPLDLAEISPYPTEHINRFGVYSTHELGIALEDERVPAA
ncbi:Tn3 family transposase [Streptomyces sp. NPDC000609]|uniref:Tn3 family transposase n=1 Tax=Streptomyces sp. NPDC000609 TaxID=3160957 RepID=UPI00339ADF46